MLGSRRHATSDWEVAIFAQKNIPSCALSISCLPNDQKTQVTDTPGLCDTHRSDKEVLKEISKSVALVAPGPHVILMVLRCDRRFTELQWCSSQLMGGIHEEIMHDDGDEDDGGLFASPALESTRLFVTGNSDTDDTAENVEATAAAENNEVRILVIGKTGNGKSSVCNTILGREEFKTGRSMSSTTLEAQTAEVERGGRRIKVNVILYTQEEHDIYRGIKSLWGDNSFCKRLVVAFTFGDLQGEKLEEELKTACGELQNVLKDAGRRYVVFDNGPKTTAEDKARTVNKY
nr:hypothetical protein BaRGS_011037 [Batillaria attramentaria]